MSKILIELAAQDGISAILNGQIAKAKELQKAYSAAARLVRAENFQETGRWALPSQSRGGTGVLGALGLGGIAPQVAAVAATALSIYSTATGFIGKIVEGAKMQNDALRVASDISTRLGASFRESRAIVAGSQAEIQKLASALPGDTRSYQQVFNGIAVAVAKNAQGDKERFRTDTLDLTKRFGAMAAITNSDPTDAGQAINRFLSGTATFGEISRIDAIQKNTGFVDTFRSLATEKGLNTERSKSWSFAQRMDILKRAAEKSMPDELLDEFANSVDGLFQTLKDKIVSPISGVFGVLKQVESRDNRTFMDAVKSLLSASNRLSESLGVIARSMGLTDTPMALMIDFIDSITRIVSRVAVDIERVNLAKLWDVGKVVEVAGSMGNSVGKWLGETLAYILNPVTLIPLLSKIVLSVFVFLGQAVNGFLGGLFTTVTSELLKAIKVFINFVARALRSVGESLLAMIPKPSLPGGGIVTGAASFLTSPITSTISAGVEGLKNATGIDLSGLPGIPNPPQQQPTNNLTFNLPENTKDPEAIASYVVDKLNSLYQTVSTEVLA